MSRSIQAVPAAPGVAQGRWTLIGRTADHDASSGSDTAPLDRDAELARIHEAARTAAEELTALARSVGEAGHEAESAIFIAQAAMAADPALIDGARLEVDSNGLAAPAAVRSSAATIAALLTSLDDELLRARAADVVDVGDRIARILAGVAGPETILAAPAIVVAEDLSPSMTATLPRDRVLGIALEASSPTAHAAILARAYGIPAVVGASGLLAALAAAGPDAELAFDGDTGTVLIEPDASERMGFATRASRDAERRDRDLREAGLPAATTDGTTIELLANIGAPGEAPEAIRRGAAGVGLFRTEFLFLERSTAPSEDEQADAYRAVVEAFDGRPITIRLLDVGGDKPIPYLPIAREDNPFLGVRALRLARERPDVFLGQLRACYRAAVAGPVKVMAPMIADASDAAFLIELAARAHDDLVASGAPIGDIDLGVMLEIPSAILAADSYFGQLQFGSLGTNDLLQYTLAVDRGNPALEAYRDPLHPAVLRLVRMAVVAAQRAGIGLSVCGEMAGDPASALVLAGLGIRSLSMSATSLAAVRRAIRAAALADLETMAMTALDARSARDVRMASRALLEAGPEA